MTAVHFEPRGFDYTIRFRYDLAIVELIKLDVPGYARSWDPVTKTWTVEAVYARPLAMALRRLSYTVHGLDDPPPQRQHTADQAGWAKAVFQRVGPNRAPLAYKLLSRLCHPDHGGDHQLQVELNRAYAELPTERQTA